MYEFDNQELRMLISGNFSFRKCLECDGLGWVWFDTDIGEMVNAPMSSDNPYKYEKDSCNFCRGLGGFLRLGDGN